MASVPMSTFMFQWAIYIFPRLIYLFCCRKTCGRSWEYINRSQTRECGNWDWGRAIPLLGIHKWDFRCSSTESMVVRLSSRPSASVVRLYLLYLYSCYIFQTFFLLSSHWCSAPLDLLRRQKENSNPIPSRATIKQTLGYEYQYLGLNVYQLTWHWWK